MKPTINFFTSPYRMYSTMIIDGKSGVSEIVDNLNAGYPLQVDVDFDNNRKTIIGTSIQSGDRTMNLNFAPEGSPVKFHVEGSTSFFDGEYRVKSYFKKIGKQQLATYMGHLRQILEIALTHWKIEVPVNCVIVANSAFNSFKLDCTPPEPASPEIRFGMHRDHATQWYSSLDDQSRERVEAQYLGATGDDSYRMADASLKPVFLDWLNSYYSSKYRHQVEDYIRFGKKKAVLA